MSDEGRIESGVAPRTAPESRWQLTTLYRVVEEHRAGAPGNGAGRAGWAAVLPTLRTAVYRNPATVAAVLFNTRSLSLRVLVPIATPP